MVQADPPTLAATIATEALSEDGACGARGEKNSKALGVAQAFGFGGCGGPQ